MFNPNEHLIDLKGKKYLQVMYRLVWFREEKPLWSIETFVIALEENKAVFRAEIKDENGRVISTGFGSETQKDFNDFIEKAETKAIGRALAMLGYGTQFAPELDEGERIVDSPVEMHKPSREERIKQLIELAATKGYTVSDICKKAGISDIKFIKNEFIESFSVGFAKLPDKQGA
jgi:hypothetical protein